MIIHIDSAAIVANKVKLSLREGNLSPVIICKDDNQQMLSLARQVNILDDDGNVVARIVYNPAHPLQSGASCWIEASNIHYIK